MNSEDAMEDGHPIREWSEERLRGYLAAMRTLNAWSANACQKVEAELERRAGAQEVECMECGSTDLKPVLGGLRCRACDHVNEVEQPEP